MTGTNGFLPWATGVGANVLNDADYAVSDALPQGAQRGRLPSPLYNKINRQTSVIASMIGHFIVSRANVDANDSQSVSLLKSNFEAALAAYINFIVGSVSPTNVPIIPASPVTLYVSPTGSDTTGDGTSTKPFATTIAAASAARKYFLTGQTLTIQHADGTYPAPGMLPATSGAILLKGNSANPAACSFAGAGPSGINGFLVSSPTPFSIDGFTLNNTGTSNNTIGGYASFVNIANTVFQSAGGAYAMMVAFPGCQLNIGSGVVVSGNMGSVLYALGGGIVTFASFAVSSALGTTTLGYAFARADDGGRILPATGASISGVAAALRYAAVRQSEISSNLGGANFYPGDRPGTVDASSIYV